MIGQGGDPAGLREAGPLGRPTFLREGLALFGRVKIAAIPGIDRVEIA